MPGEGEQRELIITDANTGETIGKIGECQLGYWDPYLIKSDIECAIHGETAISDGGEDVAAETFDTLDSFDSLEGIRAEMANSDGGQILSNNGISSSCGCSIEKQTQGRRIPYFVLLMIYALYLRKKEGKTAQKD